MQRSTGTSFVHVDDGSPEALDLACEKLADAFHVIAEQVQAVRAVAVANVEVRARANEVAALALTSDLLALLEDLRDAETPDDLGVLRERARALLVGVE